MSDPVSIQFSVVDDDEDGNYLYSLAIKRVFGDVRVASFTSPRKALDHFEALALQVTDNTRHVLFLDINMPEIDGWRFLKEAEKLPASMKESMHIFILSSSVSDVDKETSARFSQVLNYVEKPLTKSKLEELRDVIFSSSANQFQLQTGRMKFYNE